MDTVDLSFLSELPEVSVADLTQIVESDGYTMELKPGATRGKRVYNSIEHAEEIVPEAPNPPKYYGGQFRFLPIKSCADAMEATAEKLGTDGRQFRTVCLTCQEQLIEPTCEMVDEGGNAYEYVRTTASMFGAANDHCRTNFNHAVVVEHIESGLPLWMSAYSVTASVSAPISA